MGIYTKDDFLKEYEKSGWKFSDADYRLATSRPDVGMNMLTYARDYQNAQDDAARNAAHDNMEKLRQAYGGYSGGDDGSGFILTGETPTSFSYDPETDPLYAAYRKQYLREGDRQTRDTMASFASMTGGRPSTAAVSAAQQAGNYYNAQLTDKIPELYQMYYNQYRQQLEDQRSADQYGRNMAASEADSEWQRQYNLALLAAQYGDYSKLRELGIDVPGSGTTEPTNPSTTPTVPSTTPGTPGTTRNEQNASAPDPSDPYYGAYEQLLAIYGGLVIPASDWDAYEEADRALMTSWGFRRGNSPAAPITDGNHNEDKRSTETYAAVAAQLQSMYPNKLVPYGVYDGYESVYPGLMAQYGFQRDASRKN